MGGFDITLQDKSNILEPLSFYFRDDVDELLVNGQLVMLIKLFDIPIEEWKEDNHSPYLEELDRYNFNNDKGEEGSCM